MFEIPTNSKKDIRPEVVDLVCKAFFTKREMYWSDIAVYENGRFRSSHHHDGDGEQSSFCISTTEREAAFERFRDKGYHIFYSEWYAPNGRRLYCYRLHEVRRVDNGNGYYIF
jgi:hypothetical protein